MRAHVITFSLAAMLGWAGTPSFTTEALAQARYQICDEDQFNPPGLFILSRRTSAPGDFCFKELRETRQPTPMAAGRAASNRLRAVAAAASGNRDYRFAYIVEASRDSDRRLDRVISIKERKFVLDPSAEQGAVVFTEEVLLKRKGESVREVRRRGRTIKEVGIRTRCGDRFYRNIPSSVRDKVSVGILEYNNYHRNPSTSSDILSDFHVEFSVVRPDGAGGLVDRL